MLFACYISKTIFFNYERFENPEPFRDQTYLRFFLSNLNTLDQSLARLASKKRVLTLLMTAK